MEYEKGCLTSNDLVDLLQPVFFLNGAAGTLFLPSFLSLFFLLLSGFLFLVVSLSPGTLVFEGLSSNRMSSSVGGC